MGIVYKVKPEIIKFIIDQKKEKSSLSCRGLVALVEKKFRVKLSKSSINSIIKESGLSMPVGRRKIKPIIQVKPSEELKAALSSAAEGIKLLGVPTEKPVERLTEKIAEKPAGKPIELPAEPEAEKPKEVPPEKPAEVPPEKPAKKPPEEILPAPEVVKAAEEREAECTSAILLKAADYLIGGSYNLAKEIKSRLTRPENDLSAKIESLFYLPLFGQKEADISLLNSLINKDFSLDIILTFLYELQLITRLDIDLSQLISSLTQEVRCIRINLTNGSSFYMDGQFHTVWSTQHTPFDFNATLYAVEGYVNKYLRDSSSFVLFMAPGHETPSKEFFNFLLSFNAEEKNFSKLTLYGNKFEEIEVIPVEQTKKRFFVFGLWPWQFSGYRKVKKIGEYKPFSFEPLKQDFYLAPIELELSQPNVPQSITLNGFALKTSQTEKIRLVILSNLPAETRAEEVANIYLGHWPNLEEAFQDYSRKIELFTYTAASQQVFSTEILKLRFNAPAEIKALFANYLMALDLFVKWHLLPHGFEDKDFSSMKELFYSLKTTLKREKDFIKVNFEIPQWFQFQKELAYACRRLNEREIISSYGKRLWFST